MTEQKVVLERTYVVPLRRAWNSSYHKRTKRAVRILREFASRHMKVEVEDVYIDPYLNRKIWARGNANPPRKLRVIMKKTDDGRVIVYDYEHVFKTSASEGKDREVRDSLKKEEKSTEENEMLRSGEDEGKEVKDSKNENQLSTEEEKSSTKSNTTKTGKVDKKKSKS